MAVEADKRGVLTELVTQSLHSLARPAQQFLDGLLHDESLLDRMQFCRCEERARLRNSVLISLEAGVGWAVLLGNDPEGGPTGSQARARLTIEGLDLTAAQVLGRLRSLPIWFLALDEALISPIPGEASRREWTAHSLAELHALRIRRCAILDQIDTALEAGDRAAYERLRTLLVAVGE